MFYSTFNVILLDFKAALIDLFGVLGAAEQAVNTFNINI